MKEEQKIYIYVGSILLFILCSLFHFTYEFLGKSEIISGLFPISESIWEHMKLPFYSVLIVNLIPWCKFIKELSIKKTVYTFCRAKPVH